LGLDINIKKYTIYKHKPEKVVIGVYNHLLLSGLNFFKKMDEIIKNEACSACGNEECTCAPAEESTTEESTTEESAE